MKNNHSEIEIKVLEMSWDYFKLLAQQRVTHFNLFIVILGAMSAVLATQLYTDLRGNLISLALSIVQLLLCFIFYKIDVRNKFLIKHNEQIIIEYESKFDKRVPKIFYSEKNKTQCIRDIDKRKLFFFRQLSTSQLYNLFYSFFAFVSIFEGVIAIALIISATN